MPWFLYKHQGGKVVKIKCKKILSVGPNRKDMGAKTEDLTIGKEYIVLGVLASYGSLINFHIETDCGDLVIFDADMFDVISNYIPSSWVLDMKCETGGSCYLNLYPKKWNEYPHGFYEEITDVSWPLHEWLQYERMPEVVSLYFQERDLIYREESEYEKRGKL